MSLVNDVNKNKIMLTHKLQRKEGQWNKNQKTDLIVSIIKKFPINPTYAIVENKTSYVIDGVQRLSTIRDFINDKLKLTKSAPVLTVENEKVELAEKTFSQLSENVQDIIKNYELDMYLITEYTPEEIREMFRCINGGAKLTKAQQSVVYINDDTLRIMNTVLDKEFWGKTALTPTDVRKNTDRDILVQSLYFLSGQEITDFSNETLYQKFINNLSEKDTEKLFDKLNEVLNQLTPLFEEKQKKLKKVSIAPMINGANYCLTKKKSIESYVKYLNENFFAKYDDLDEYTQYCKSGSANKENILGRKKYFEKIVDSL